MLVYNAICSLDGYTADRDGGFDWSMPDEEVHAAVNDLERDVSTYLLGRRMYEVSVVWETMPVDDEPEVVRDFAEIWHGKDKVVYSTTLEQVSSARTRIERTFEPSAVRDLVESAGADVSIGGSELAGHAFRAGLVGEVRLFLSPVSVGGGTAALPPDVRLSLELLSARRFGNGVVFLRHRVR